ncbi:MAG TPA: exonuclease domain-containing protein, partial [Acidimicrobiales bacterium]|nr:exonuclease domain-containing protein [Acidimicrobiales bacterium]
MDSSSMNRTNVGNSLLDGLETENRNDRPCWSSEQLLGFDLETTGVDPFSDVPVSAALVHVNAGSPELTDHFIIDPEREIPAGATAVHGITTERAREFGIPLDQGLDRIMNALNSSAANDIPVVGMNICYD